ncbi:hypothetical protein [Vagococcus sp.]|uniref:hypothetical protein n=1 Tax=Vagococcus sp. TaxID=1933889 RepID=UPI002FCB56B8
MNLSDITIDKPTEKEKEKSIQFILENLSPQQKPFSQFVLFFFREFDSRVIFWGLKDVLVITVSVIFSLLLFFIFLVREMSVSTVFLFRDISETVYFFSFLLSPVVFSLLHYLSIWKEIQLKTFELKMTLKVSLKEIMTIRTLIFSVISLFSSVFFSFFLWFIIDQPMSLLKLISLSSSSLFLFSIIQIILDNMIQINKSYIVSPIFWLGVASLLIHQKDKVIRVLMILPESLVLVLTGIFIISFILLLRRNYLKQEEGGLSYVRA